MFYITLGQSKQDEKEALVRKHFINEQMKTYSEMFFERQISLVKEGYSELPDSIWSDVRKEVDEVYTFLNETIKIYFEYFSLEELKEICKALSFPQ